MGKARSTTTSRVMKGAAVSLRLSLSTLSAQGRYKRGSALSSSPLECHPQLSFYRGRWEGSERVHDLPTITKQDPKWPSDEM